MSKIKMTHRYVLKKLLEIMDLPWTAGNYSQYLVTAIKTRLLTRSSYINLLFENS